MTKTADGDHLSTAKLLLQQSENRDLVEIPRLNSASAYRTLGVLIAANGSQQRQLEVLQKHVDVWKKAIGHSLLKAEEKQISYAAFLHLQLAYPM